MTLIKSENAEKTFLYPALVGRAGPALVGRAGPALVGRAGPALVGRAGPALVGRAGPALVRPVLEGVRPVLEGADVEQTGGGSGARGTYEGKV